MKNLISLAFILLFCSCSDSEKNTFDFFYKQNMGYYLLGYCDKSDSTCIADVNQYLDGCFDEIDFDSSLIFPEQNLIESDDFETMLKTINMEENRRIGNDLNQCMLKFVRGSFAENFKNGQTNWETNIKISKPNLNTDKSKSILIAIKDNGKIYFNKDIIKVSDVKTNAIKFKSIHLQVRAVIIADRDSKTSDLVTVMDQLKSAGIENISIAANK